MMTRARVAAAGVLTVLIVSIGCNSGNPDAPCHIQGKVTYNGNPVTGGFVYFHQSDGTKVSLPIFANGTYSGDLKEGTLTVTVDTESINPNRKEDPRGHQGGGAAGAYGGAGAQKGASAAVEAKYKQQSSPTPKDAGPQPAYMKIPSKYENPSTSNLSVTTKRGKNEYNIPLTD
jgi:hypothetical protein